MTAATDATSVAQSGGGESSKQFELQQQETNPKGKKDHTDARNKDHPLVGNYIRALRQIKHSLNKNE